MSSVPVTPSWAATAEIALSRSRSRRVAFALFWCVVALAYTGGGIALWTTVLLDPGPPSDMIILGLLSVVVPAVAVSAAVPAVRAVLTSPVLRLEADDLVFADPVLLRREVRIPRANVRRVRKVNWAGERLLYEDDPLAELTPFREPLDLEIKLRSAMEFETARGSRTGNWIWHFGRRWQQRPLFPQPRGRTYDRLWFRVDDPDAALARIGAWIEEGR